LQSSSAPRRKASHIAPATRPALRSVKTDAVFAQQVNTPSVYLVKTASVWCVDPNRAGNATGTALRQDRRGLEHKPNPDTALRGLTRRVTRIF